MSYEVMLSLADTGPAEEQAIAAALRSGWVTSAGPCVDGFEREMAQRIGVEHAVALSSGTAALHLALVSWGVGPGDVVPVSTLTFAATVNAIRYVGATPHFVDSDAESGNMSVELLDQAVRALTAAGHRVPVVVPVDLLGKSAEYESIGAIAASVGARVLADSAESVGASYRGRPAGAWGDAAAFSFNGNKMMTTSGGGMLLTDDDRLAARVRKLATQAREPVHHYEHTEVGYNYRLSNLLAAVGRVQLTRLDGMLERRRVWRERYRDLFAAAPGVRILGGDDDALDNCWLSAVIVDPTVSPWTNGDLASALAAVGVESRPVWKPMHLQPVWSGLAGTLDGTAERLFDTGLTLPSGSAMTEDQFARISDAIQALLRRCAA